MNDEQHTVELALDIYAVYMKDMAEPDQEQAATAAAVLAEHLISEGWCKGSWLE